MLFQHQLMSRISTWWRRVSARPPIPEDEYAILVSPLFTRVGSVVFGHITGLIGAVGGYIGIGGPVTIFFLSLHSLCFVLRVALLAYIRLRPGPSFAKTSIRLVPYYFAIGIFWSFVFGLSSATFLFLSPNDWVRLLSLVGVCGTCGGIASRNSRTPVFAIGQISAMLLPSGIIYATAGGLYFFLSFFAFFYLISLASMVRQQNSEFTALLRTERVNRTLATQLNAAISNMTQGLLLFGHDDTLQLVNRRFRELFPMPEDWLPTGASLAYVAERCASLGLGGGWIEPAQGNPAGEGRDEGATEVRDLPDGRAITIGYQRLENGGRVVTFEDFTNRRQAEMALAEREGELSAIFANAAAGVVETDFASGGFTRVNAAFCQMVGYSEEALLAGMTISDLIHPVYRGPGGSSRRQVALWDGVSSNEQLYMRPDGTQLWARSSHSVTAFDARGLPLRLVSVFHDITDRKEAEASLRESNELLRLSMAAGKIGEYRADIAARQIHCSAAARAIHGFPMGDAPLSEADWLDMLVEEDRARIVDAMQAHFARRAAEMTVEYRFRRPGETEIRHAELRASIGYDGAGQPLETIGVMIDVTERRQAQARIAHLAHHDPLTGLPNRTLFHAKLEEAMARAHRGAGFALCYLDLDHFKEVNDTLGHPVGDALLCAVTGRLRAELRGADTVARLGGDEFAIILTSPERSDDVSILAQRLIDSISAPYNIEGHTVIIGASMGIAAAPADGLECDQLLKNADTALYRAKLAGRGRFRCFELEMDAQIRARRAIEHDLRLAIELGEFELFYQPLIDIATRRVSGLEALIRWRHAERGLVAPHVFISLVEANGLIQPIGAWALREACRQLTQWPDIPRVAVNLSVAQFPSSRLVEDVDEALRESGLDPRRLELEITETVMLQDTETTLTTLHRLKALGLRIALDDFGTGYSSLSYLQRFPFDKVKIDRSFVTHLGRRPESSTIMRAMLDLCRALSMSTLAEGVETEGQLQALAAEGCKEAQGFLFSRACPAGEVLDVVARINATADALVLLAG